jgi:predicted transcriptional regulator
MAKSVQDEIDHLRSRVLALEQDNEMLVGIVRNISKLFENTGREDDKLEDIPFKKVDAVIRRIDKGDIINATQYGLIEKYSDKSVYADAEWFRKQIVAAFEKTYYRINKVQPVEMKFDEVKVYLQDISKMPDKVELQTYIRSLKPK